MPRLIPNPAGDLMRRVDKTLENVDTVLARVDGTLADVNAKLGNVDSTLRDATTVLIEVQSLLTEFRDEIELLREVPAIKQQLDDIYRVVVTTKP
jgi:hypothetical protein